MTRDELLKSMGRKEIDTITKRGKQLLLTIVSLAIDCGCDWFYKFSTRGIGNDLEVSFDLTDFDLIYSDSTQALLAILQDLKSLKFVSRNGYITVVFVIKDFYEPFV